MALVSAQPLVKMSTRNISWTWRRLVREADNLTTFMCQMSWKSGSLNLLEPPGPHQACYGTPHPHIFVTHRFMECMYVLKFWEAFWHLSNAFNFRLPVKRLLIHSKKILLLTKYRRVLEVHFTVLLSTVPFKRMYITTQVIRVLLTVP